METSFLDTVPETLQLSRVDKFMSSGIEVLIFAHHCFDAVSHIFLKAAERYGVNLYTTATPTSEFMAQLIVSLYNALAPRTMLHGVLMEICGEGVLITGESGVGKSECALELIKRGHLLVADDVVDIARVGHKLRGESPEIVRDFMELRGIGIVDIKLIFGIGAILRKKTIDMVVHLEFWTPGKDYDRLGAKDNTMEILGVQVPLINVPVRSGRNLALIVEIAARNWRLKAEGYNAVSELDRRLEKLYGGKA